MGLKIELAPGERLHIGISLTLTNGVVRSAFLAEGDMPLLRGRMYMNADAVKTVMDKVYHRVQRIYLADSYAKDRIEFAVDMRSAMRAYPQHSHVLVQVMNQMELGKGYAALTLLRPLLAAVSEPAPARVPARHFV